MLFVCSVCALSFETHADLQSHIKTCCNADYGNVDYDPEAGLSLLSLLATSQRKHEGDVPPGATIKECSDTFSILAATSASLSSTAQGTDRSSGYLRRRWDTRANGFEKWRLVDGNGGPNPCGVGASNKKQEGNGRRSRRAGQPPPKAKYAVDRVLVPAGSSGANDSGYLYSKFSFKTVLRPKTSAKGSEEEDATNADPSSDGTFVFKKFYATKGKPDVVNSIVSQSYQWPQIANNFQSRPGEQSSQRYPLLAPKATPNVGCEGFCAPTATIPLAATSQEVNIPLPVGACVVTTSVPDSVALQSSWNESSRPILPYNDDGSDSRNTIKLQEFTTVQKYGESVKSPVTLDEVERDGTVDISETNVKSDRASNCTQPRNLCSGEHVHVSNIPSPSKSIPLGKTEVNEKIVCAQDSSDKSDPYEVASYERILEQGMDMHGIIRPTLSELDQVERSSWKVISPDLLPGKVKEMAVDQSSTGQGTSCLLTTSRGLQLETTDESEVASDDSVFPLRGNSAEKETSQDEEKFVAEKKDYISCETNEGNKSNESMKEFFANYQDLVSFTKMHRRKGPLLVETLQKRDSSFFSPPSLQVQAERYLYLHGIVRQSSCDKHKKEYQHLNMDSSSILGSHAYQIYGSENVISLKKEHSQVDEDERGTDFSGFLPAGSLSIQSTAAQVKIKMVEDSNISRKDAKCQTDFVMACRRNEVEGSRTKVLQRSVACQTSPKVLCCTPNCFGVGGPMKGSLADVRSPAMRGYYNLSTCHNKCRFCHTKRFCSPTSPSSDTAQRLSGTLGQAYNPESRIRRSLSNTCESRAMHREPVHEERFETGGDKVLRETIQGRCCNVGATKIANYETGDDHSLQHVNATSSLLKARYTEQCGNYIARQKPDSNKIPGVPPTTTKDCHHLKSKLTKDFSYCAKCCVLSDCKSESVKAFEGLSAVDVSEKAPDFEEDEGKKSLLRNPGVEMVDLSQECEGKPSQETRISPNEDNQEEVDSACKDGSIFFCKICCLVYSSLKDYECHLTEQSKCRTSTSLTADAQPQPCNNSGNSDGTRYDRKECPGYSFSTSKPADLGTGEDVIPAASTLKRALINVAGTSESSSRAADFLVEREWTSGSPSLACRCSISRHEKRERGTGVCDFNVKDDKSQIEDRSVRCSAGIAKEVTGTYSCKTRENTAYRGGACHAAAFLRDSLARSSSKFAHHPSRKRSCSWRDNRMDAKRIATVQGPRRHSLSQSLLSIEHNCMEMEQFGSGQSLDTAEVLRPAEKSPQSSMPCVTKSLSRLQKFVKENSRPSQNFWRCANCQFLFTTRTEYIDHMLNCACGSDFKTPRRQLREILMHRKTGKTAKSDDRSASPVENSPSGTGDQGLQLWEQGGSTVHCEVQEMDKCARIEPFVRCSQCSVIFTSFKILDSHCCDPPRMSNL